MNKKLFTGWTDVFKFTLLQATRGKGFRLVTYGVSLVIIIAMIVLNVIFANNQSKDSEETAKKSEIDTVYVVNETDIENVDFGIITQVIEFKYDEVKFVISDKNKTTLINENTVKDGKNLILYMTKEKDEYNLDLIIPYDSAISKSEGNSFLNDLNTCFYQYKLIHSGVAWDKQILLFSNLNVEVLKAGEAAETIGEKLVRMLLPMLMSLIFYMFVLLYGQSIGTTVMAEKSSKLMETLLVSIKPSAIIAGKILAMTSIGLYQIALWIISGVSGFLIGNFVGKEVYSEYSNVVLQVIDLLKEDTQSAFSVESIILAILILFIGFLFYSVMAGLIAANVSKAEELASGMGIYQLIVIACFFGTYFTNIGGADGGNSYSTLFACIPFTAPFILPADLIAGNVTVLIGILGMILLIIMTILAIIFTGKVYKDKIFYNGSSKKLSLSKKR